MVTWIVAILILTGAAFALVGSLGLLRMRDFYLRLHGPTKITTFGLGCLLLASVPHFAQRGQFGLHEMLISLFLFITAPVSAHMLSKAALHLRVRSFARTPEQQDQPAERT